MNQHAEKVGVLYSCLCKSLEWIKFRFRLSITMKNLEVFLLNRTQTSILPFSMRLRTLIFTLSYMKHPWQFTLQK